MNKKTRNIYYLIVIASSSLFIILLLYGIACGVAIGHINGWDFSKSGPMGDTINGIITPIIAIANLIVLILLTKNVSLSDDRRMITQFRYERFNELKEKLKEFNYFSENYDSMKINYRVLGEYLLEFNSYNKYLFEDHKEFTTLLKQLANTCGFIAEECTHIHEVSKKEQLPAPEGAYFFPFGSDLYKNYKKYITNFKSQRKELISLFQGIIIGKA